MEKYLAMVEEWLEIAKLEEGIPNQETCQAVFLPSFHPEVAIRVFKDNDSWQVELRTCGINLYQHGGQLTSRTSNQAPQLEESEILKLEVRQSELDGEQAARLTEALTTADIALWDEEALGLDGMTFDITHRNGGGKLDKKQVWLQDKNSAPNIIANLLFDAAATLETDPVIQSALEGLHIYLDRGIPARVVADSPLTVRIFGRLSVRQEAELAEFFKALPATEPLLIDLSNFEAMGTMLHPVFEKFVASREAKTAWWINETAQMHLEQLGVSTESMADTAEAALKLLE